MHSEETSGTKILSYVSEFVRGFKKAHRAVERYQ